MGVSNGFLATVNNLVSYLVLQLILWASPKFSESELQANDSTCDNLNKSQLAGQKELTSPLMKDLRWSISVTMAIFGLFSLAFLISFNGKYKRRRAENALAQVESAKLDLQHEDK